MSPTHSRAALLFTLYFLMVAPAFSTAPDISQEGKSPIGVLTLPELFGVPDPKGPPGSLLVPPSGKLVLHKTPHAAATAIGGGIPSLRTFAIGRDHPAALVFQKQSGGWYQVERKDNGERGWVHSSDPKDFTDMREALLIAFIYTLRGDWDRKLHAAPGAESLIQWENRSPVRLLGCAAMPKATLKSEIKDNNGTVRRSYHPLEIDVRDQPAHDGKIIAQIPASGAFAVARTVMNCQPLPPFGEPIDNPVAVLQVRGDWYEVLLQPFSPYGGAHGWVDGKKLGQLHRIPPGPGLEAARKEVYGDELVLRGWAVRVSDIRWLKNVLWAKVVVQSASILVEESPVDLGEGWVKVFDPTGQFILERHLD